MRAAKGSSLLSLASISIASFGFRTRDLPENRSPPAALAVLPLGVLDVVLVQRVRTRNDAQRARAGRDGRGDGADGDGGRAEALDLGPRGDRARELALDADRDEGFGGVG